MNSLLIGLAIIVVVLITALVLGLSSRALTGFLDTGGAVPPSRDPRGLVLRGAEVEMRELRPGAAQPMARLAGEVEQRRRDEAAHLYHDPMTTHPGLTFVGLR